MSSIAPNIEDKVPGLQYPPDLDENSPQSRAVRNIIDNLFYVRRIIEDLPSANSILTKEQIQQLVTQIITSTTINVTSNPVVVTTHAIRLATTPTLGALIFEYDRMSLYVGSDSTGTILWTWTAGNMIAAVASIPVDLTTTDKGFIFTSNTADQETQYVWTGTEFITSGGYLQEIADAVTNAITTALLIRHVTSGAATTGFGLGVVTQLEDSGGNSQTAAYGTVEWDSAATNNSLRRWWLRVAGVLTDLMQLASTTLTIIGNYVWKSGTANTGTLDHANSGNRTYTFADADGNIVYETAALTNNNFVYGGGGALAKDAGFNRATIISDTVYGAGWNGVTDIAPSQNAVYDKIETLLSKNGVNFGPAAVASITVVDGQITAIA